MSPYRTPSRPTRRAACTRGDAEGVALALLWLLVGVVPVGVALVRHAPWDWQPSLGALFVALGAWSLVREIAVLRRHAAA